MHTNWTFHWVFPAFILSSTSVYWNLTMYWWASWIDYSHIPHFQKSSLKIQITSGLEKSWMYERSDTVSITSLISLINHLLNRLGFLFLKFPTPTMKSLNAFTVIIEAPKTVYLWSQPQNLSFHSYNLPCYSLIFHSLYDPLALPPCPISPVDSDHFSYQPPSITTMQSKQKSKPCNMHCITELITTNCPDRLAL